jgi:hypothetical protein
MSIIQAQATVAGGHFRTAFRTAFTITFRITFRTQLLKKLPFHEV